MTGSWLPLEGVPGEGREFTFSDQELWASRFKEFGLPYTVGQPLTAVVRITPQGEGCLVKGKLTGSVILPCSRCVEDFEQEVDAPFTLFEQVSSTEDKDAPPEETLLRSVGDGLELDIDGLLWEQFVLAMPQRALCSRECKGLCPSCGGNMNQEACECGAEAGDPRMAVFRNMKVKR